jgi:hypothetical protein
MFREASRTKAVTVFFLELCTDGAGQFLRAAPASADELAGEAVAAGVTLHRPLSAFENRLSQRKPSHKSLVFIEG